MSWFVPETQLQAPRRDRVFYRVVQEGHPGHPRHYFTIGAHVAGTFGLKSGDTVTLAFGEPGTEHEGLVRIAKASDGQVTLRHKGAATTSVFLSTRAVAPWVSPKALKGVLLNWKKDGAGGLILSMPSSALIEVKRPEISQNPPPRPAAGTTAGPIVRTPKAGAPPTSEQPAPGRLDIDDVFRELRLAGNRVVASDDALEAFYLNKQLVDRADLIAAINKLRLAAKQPRLEIRQVFWGVHKKVHA